MRFLAGLFETGVVTLLCNGCFSSSGLFSVIQVSDLEVTCSDTKSPVSNAIYFMLTQDEPRNYVHWLYSDDYQTLIEGGPADYYIFHANGSTEKFTMGGDIENGQTMVVPCPANSAKAIVLHEDASHLLVSSVVTPAWSPQRARIGGDHTFIEKYSGSSDWASPEFLTFLIGPNFGHEIGADGDGFHVTIDETGQIIWKGMQLNEKQVAVELKSFLAKTPARAFQISIHPNAPQAIIERLKDLASQMGIHETELTQISNHHLK